MSNHLTIRNSTILKYNRCTLYSSRQLDNNVSCFFFIFLVKLWLKMKHSIALLCVQCLCCGPVQFFKQRVILIPYIPLAEDKH